MTTLPSDAPVLLIVFGAGASHDFDPLGRQDVALRPPLTNELFTRPDLAEYRAHFPRLAGVVPRLVAASDGTSVEQTLTDLQLRADAGYAPAAREMASVRYYLREVLRACTESALGQTQHATTYAEFVRRLDDWHDRRGREWRVCLVSFNYDTLLETACSDVRRMRFETLDDYVSGDWLVLKPHGSWSWVQEVADPRYPPSEGQSRYPRASAEDLIDGFPELVLSERLFVHRAYGGYPDADSVELRDVQERRVSVVPALSLPVTGKSKFVFPASHLEQLRAVCRATTMVMTIGWHGQEGHFLHELAAVGAKGQARMRSVIVTRSERGARSVQRELERQCGISGGFVRVNRGFRSLLREPGRLEGLLW